MERPLRLWRSSLRVNREALAFVSLSVPTMSTGNGHASLFVVSKNSTTVIGEMAFYDQKADSGNTVSRGFCPNCGSPMINRATAYPDHLVVNTATLDDPSIFGPSNVLFTESSQPWDHIDLKLK